MKIFYPFYDKRIRRMTAILQEEFDTKLKTGDSFWDSIEKCLYDIFHSASVRVLIAEMHACKDMGRLQGRTPQEEYDSYCRLLEEEKYRNSISGKYAGLCPCLEEIERNQLTFWMEMLSRLHDDWRRIGETILEIREDEGWQIEAVRWAGADFHCKGKAVVSIETNHGIRIFYKPRRLRNEAFLQGLLSEIEADMGLGRPALPILEGREYGWEREVPYQECGSLEGVARFYRRTGILAAVSYVLGIGDLHYENLIAWGEYPVVIDAETMFQNMGDLYEWSAGGREFYSILSSGLFPGGGVEEGMAAVTGGRGAAQGKVPVILYEGSSEMRIGYRVPEVRQGKNRIRYQGEEMSCHGYEEEILGGFRESYQWFLCHAEEVLGRIREEADALDSRYLSGSTQFFAMAVSASMHPDLLERISGREEYLKRICNGRTLGRWEAAAMVGGDIPLFRRRLGDRHLYINGEKAEADFFDREIEKAIESRLRRLCPEDCNLQERILQASLRYFQKNTAGHAGEGFGKAGEAGWLDYAKDIAQQILGRMICHKGRIFWLGAEGDRTLRIKPMGIYFYSGLAGMAVFFRALYQECRLHEEICDRLEKELFAYTDGVGDGGIPAASEYPGMYCGEGSIIYAYQLLYQITGQEKYRDYAERHCHILTRYIGQRKHFDLLYGNAGAILVLCRQYETVGNPAWLKAACYALEQLEAARIGKSTGVSWYGKEVGYPICGIAHGNSGMLLAYARLHSLLPTIDYRQRMKEIVAYENQFVDKRSGNWADMKKEGEERYGTYAWCNAGVGAVYARVLASSWNPGEIWLREEAARGAALLEGLPVSGKMCLCHGNMGNLLILHECADYLGLRGLKEKEREFLGVMEEHRNRSFVVDEMGGDGIMCGNAGVGMGAVVLWGFAVRKRIGKE